MATSPRVILVTGDVICDHAFFLGNRMTADSPETRGFTVKRTGGGALLLKDLIASATSTIDGWTTEFGIDEDYAALPSAYHAFCLWKPEVGGADGKTEVWRAVEPPFGYGCPAGGGKDGDSVRREPIRDRKTPLAGVPEIVVIDDAGLGFRNATGHWPFQNERASTDVPRWVVMKLTGSIAEGELWNKVVGEYADKLVLIVSADQLRRRNVRLSRGLSWEATAEDLVAELDGNPLLAPLRAARHLIVTFRSDAALWFERDAGPGRSMLVFDAERAEGEWAERQGKGTAFGYLSCFTGGVVVQLAKNPDTPKLELGIGNGLAGGRELHQLGHGPVKDDHPGFPFGAVAKKLLAEKNSFVSAEIPRPVEARGTWMLLDQWQTHACGSRRSRPHSDVALAVAVVGPGALERFPVARFGGLQTVDRREIENLRVIRHLMTTYQNGGRQKQPLSIGVFGPPGAGKSFGVKQIAKSVLDLDDEDILTFNLSQFDSTADLNGAFHRVRDRAITGRTPLVFWDEFDAQEYRWLQYLLAPMQDGAFQEGQITHPVGKCFFVFAGATSPTFDTFGPLNPQDLSRAELDALRAEPTLLQEVEARWLEFVLKKGPDFKSRLAAYLDVLGPNQRQVCVVENGRRRWIDDPTDLCCPVRRALFIRSQFRRKDNQVLEIDAGVLRALLEVPRYKSGARSLEFLCQHLQRHASGAAPTRASVPGRQLLDVHVDAKEFWRICEYENEYMKMALDLAPALHEGYRLLHRGDPTREHLDKEFPLIPPKMQRANVAQALRIPKILELVGFELTRGPRVAFDDLPKAREQEAAVEGPIRELLADRENIEFLAEAEHNGWMVERMLEGLKYAPVPDSLREVTHDLIVPYVLLADHYKEDDRSTIGGRRFENGPERFGYVDLVKLAGYRVVRKATGQADTASAPISQ